MQMNSKNRIKNEIGGQYLKTITNERNVTENSIFSLINQNKWIFITLLTLSIFLIIHKRKINILPTEAYGYDLIIERYSNLID